MNFFLDFATVFRVVGIINQTFAQIRFLIYFLIDLYLHQIMIISSILYSVNNNRLPIGITVSKQTINSLLNFVPAYRHSRLPPLTSPLWKITRTPKTISKQSKLIRADARDDRVFCSRINRRVRGLEVRTCSEQIQVRGRGEKGWFLGGYIVWGRRTLFAGKVD